MVVLKILVVVLRVLRQIIHKKDPGLVIFVFHSKKKKMKSIFRKNNRMVVLKINFSDLSSFFVVVLRLLYGVVEIHIVLDY